MIEVRSVSKTYDTARNTAALRNVSLQVESGEMVALVGPSGAGKSTLLHLIGALDLPSEGSVRVDGVDLSDLDDDSLSQLRREKIGFVFQFFHLLPTLKAWENVAVPLRLAAIAGREAERRAYEGLDALGLAGKEDRLPEELSGGEQQRVAIARALIHRPAVLLADEPTGNLDSHTGAEILTLLRELRDGFGTTVLLATHNPAAAAKSDRVLELRDGELGEARA